MAGLTTPRRFAELTIAVLSGAIGGFVLPDVAALVAVAILAVASVVTRVVVVERQGQPSAWTTPLVLASIGLLGARFAVWWGVVGALVALVVLVVLLVAIGGDIS